MPNVIVSNKDNSIQISTENRKIKITRFPFREYEVGEIVDLGHEKNVSLVKLQRAVWVLEKDERERLFKQSKNSNNNQVESTSSDEEENENKSADSNDKSVEKSPANKTKSKATESSDKKVEKADVTEDIKDATENKLRDKIEEKKDGNSFWDNLK